jgi:hypothetical protein
VIWDIKSRGNIQNYTRANRDYCAKNIGEIKQDFKASLGVRSKDPISLAPYPTIVVAEGNIVHESA